MSDIAICFNSTVNKNIYRAKTFREALKRKHDVECGLAMIIKQRAKANDIEKMDLVGSVQDCDAIIGNVFTEIFFRF